jgi:hypothetical protein
MNLTAAGVAVVMGSSPPPPPTTTTTRNDGRNGVIPVCRVDFIALLIKMARTLCGQAGQACISTVASRVTNENQSNK